MDSYNKEDIVQYATFSSFIDPGFWYKLTEIKLDIDKLNESNLTIYGRYNFRHDMPCLFEVDGTSFNRDPQTFPYSINSYGRLINKNTIESLKDLDKSQLLNEEGRKIINIIKTKEWVDDPSKLVRFIVLSFANFKKYSFIYWFAYPAPIKPIAYYKQRRIQISEKLSDLHQKSLYEQYQELETKQRSFFIITVGGDLKLHRMSDYLSLELDKREDVYFAFADPSNNVNPGWPLRNYIYGLLDLCPFFYGKDIWIVSLRVSLKGDLSSSQLYEIHIPENVESDCINWVGWERNEQDKLGPKQSNMASAMDPIRLADTAADLNLKLMKWRLVPDLNLDIIKKSKCLLLGVGTLGCNVARSLLAWGFREFTFVDSGKVSYSNPARQSLFTYEDTQNGGKPKIQAAADNLKKILPSVNATGFNVHIPMPGHPCGESLKEETLKSIDVLIKLIQEHDIIFLLLDSREARWMATVLGAYYRKMVINAALGFDSYLVMRHGFGNQRDDNMDSSYVQGSSLGCYFCNDVTSPGDSQKDRTLDQQCTVTRPGVSGMAASLAVEMAVALLQHKKGINAPAPYNLLKQTDDGLDSEAEGILGPIPHSIRGFLTTYQHVLPTCTNFKQCIACSDVVLAEYRKNGVDFLLKVINDGTYLEEITGLKDLHLAAEMTEVIELSDADTD